MLWNQSDNKTIFRLGCPHMGEFTAGELCVCTWTWGSVSEALTNIQQCPGGEAERMESQGKGKAAEN